jgi:hypothetical protein
MKFESKHYLAFIDEEVRKTIEDIYSDDLKIFHARKIQNKEW